MLIKFFKIDSRGFAALFATLIILSVVLITASGLSLLTLNEKKITQNYLISNQAYLAAESGVEDSLYRIIKGKNYQASNSLDVGESNTVINISETGGQKIITSKGEKDNRFRNLKVVLSVNTDAVSFYYGVQVGEGGLSMNNGSAVTGSVYSNGPITGASSASISGDAFVASTPADINQENSLNDSSFIFGQTNPAIDAAQSFTPTISDTLTKISLNLKKTGSPSNKTIRILTDANGSPSKNLVAAGAYGTLQTSQISQNNFSWTDITFNTPPLLQAGTRYWITIDSAQDSSNYLLWGRDSTDSYLPGTGKYSPNWNASSPVWYEAGGDLNFKVWLGGIYNSLSSVSVGGNAHAHTISNSSITGDAYYQEILNSTVNGISYPGSPDPGPENMPISQANIEDWKKDAEADGVFTGNYTLVNGAVGSLGPKKIVGNLMIDNGADFTVTGTIYVTGTITISNNAIIRLGANYGELSGVVLTDGLISVSNNSIFYGNSAGTYLLFLSDKTGDAVNVANNAQTVIFYASKGNVNISNNAILKEVTAYQITLSNNSQVIYESGLASAKFSSGSGATWAIKSWNEE